MKQFCIDVIIGLAKQFSQLKLSDDYSFLDKLREECLDYILSSTDLFPMQKNIMKLEKYVTISGK